MRMMDFLEKSLKNPSLMHESDGLFGKMFNKSTLGVAEIQELGTNKSYMADVMDIITSGKEILFDILFS